MKYCLKINSKKEALLKTSPNLKLTELLNMGENIQAISYQRDMAWLQKLKGRTENKLLRKLCSSSWATTFRTSYYASNGRYRWTVLQVSFLFEVKKNKVARKHEKSYYKGHKISTTCLGIDWKLQDLREPKPAKMSRDLNDTWVHGLYTYIWVYITSQITGNFQKQTLFCNFEK